MALEAAEVALVSCTFVGNTSLAGTGGAVSTLGSDITLTNCVLTGNLAGTLAGLGGGLYFSGGTVAMHNCTVHSNRATWQGGGVYARYCSPVLANCILWANGNFMTFEETDQLVQEGAGEFDVSYSCIQSWTGSLGGDANTGDDPLFADADGLDGLSGTQDDDLRLGVDSPCIDAGDTLAVPADTFDLDGDGDTQEPTSHDLDGEPRLADDACRDDTGRAGSAGLTVDMGAYEFGDHSPSLLVGDFDADCVVGITDFLLGSWGPCVDPCPADIDGSGDVGVADFLIFMYYWANAVG